jgi:hypothetical protein
MSPTTADDLSHVTSNLVLGRENLSHVVGFGDGAGGLTEKAATVPVSARGPFRKFHQWNVRRESPCTSAKLAASKRTCAFGVVWTLFVSSETLGRDPSRASDVGAKVVRIGCSGQIELFFHYCEVSTL